MTVKVSETLRVSNLNCSQLFMTMKSFMASDLVYFLPSSDFSFFCVIREISSTSFVEDLTILAFPAKSNPLSFHVTKDTRNCLKTQVKCVDLTTDTA